MNSKQPDRMNVLCIIPARGGSKGIPGKNLIKIEGQTLIQYAVDCAKEAVSTCDIVVSSDSDAILEHAKQLEVEALKRPEELATDDAPVVAAVKHCLYEMEEQRAKVYDLIVLLQPTSPIRTGRQLDAVIQRFTDSEVQGVISVVSSNEMHPARMYRKEDGLLVPLSKSNETAHRQTIEPVYYRNGCFYAVRREVFLAQNTLMPELKTPFVMPYEQLCNIDEPVDLILAEALVKAWRQGRI